MFFLTIIVAAMTSSISLLEVGVAYFVEEKKMKRPLACIVVFAIAWLLGLSSVFSQKAFGLTDAFSSNILLTVGALLVVLFVGWKMKKEDVRDEITDGGTRPGNGKLFPVVYFLIRYLAPVAVLVIFFSNFFL
jgi:NSS family neurotransmitter:Na+ symporter